MAGYDVIVVGARCAGSPTAMRLAQQGHRVLLLDRASFPSDAMPCHYIHFAGVQQLHRWGLLDRVAASNCPPIRQITKNLDDFSLTAQLLGLDEVGGLYAPRRTVLDKILVDAAAEAGVEVRQQFAVLDVTSDGDRVTGIRGRSNGGATVTESARVVVGADGLHSLVARAVGAPMYHATPPLTFAYYSYWENLDCAGFESYLSPRHHQLTLAFPTNDQLVCVAVTRPIEQFRAFRSNTEGHFAAALEAAPELAERIRSARRVERFQGTADLPNFFRRPYGSGWALVGDAGYHRDPITGQGISDAFRDAELLAQAIHAGLSGRRPLVMALAGYENARNRAALSRYEDTRQAALLDWPPEQEYALRAALRTNPDDTSWYYSVRAGILPADEFYAADNLERIMGELGSAPCRIAAA